MRTVDEYKKSLQNMRPNIYKFGELIEDVTTHPATKRTVAGHAKIYAAAQDEKHHDLVTRKSTLIEPPIEISRYLSLIRSESDMITNIKMKRLMFNITGTCTGGRCVGWNAINSMWATTYDIDQETGTDYHERIKTWLMDAQKRDITIAGALTDPKGDRTLNACQQPDPDMNLHIIETREDGIVVRGAKVMICGVAAANEIFILPGTGYKEQDKDYAVSFVIPRDTENLSVIETRHPSDLRDFEEGYDNPVTDGGITQAYLLFEDVFIPKQRVFMAGEFKFALNAVLNFIMPYRSAIGGCVAGQGDVMAGAAALVARANGLSEKQFNEKFVKMYINNETTFGMGVAAAAMGKLHPSGIWQPDPLLANVNKVHVGTLPYETKRIAQDISGGIAETGCMPSYKDLTDDKHGYGKLLQKYLKAYSDAEPRVRAARLVEWLTLGSGVPGCMHGGGSPEGAKLVIRSLAGLKKSIEHAKHLAGIKEELEPKKIEKK
jgi:4-hydroxybutyryl-CoA dehydratase/vinylacetyl-CoA-Delta-isomerase